MPAQLRRILMKLRYRSFTTRTVPGARAQEEEEEEEEGETRGEEEGRKRKKNSHGRFMRNGDSARPESPLICASVEP